MPSHYNYCVPLYTNHKWQNPNLSFYPIPKEKKTDEKIGGKIRRKVVMPQKPNRFNKIKKQEKDDALRENTLLNCIAEESRKLKSSQIKLKRLQAKTDYSQELLSGLNASVKENIELMNSNTFSPNFIKIPNFLSDEECDHIVHLAEKTGLISSFARGGLQSPEEFRIPDIRNGTSEGMTGYFEAFDLDSNEKVHLEEVMAFAKKYHFLILTKEETLELLNEANITEFDDGFATREEFERMNSLGLSDALYATGLSHPLHRARFSQQTWVNQRGMGDPVLDKIMERVVELTRLPREIIYGSERLQVVYYGANGHYHAHYDSETHKRTDVRCCHLHDDIMETFQKGEGCRLCRYVTILYYLNNVEEGGETAFPVADNTSLDMEQMTASRGDFDLYNLSHNCHKGNLVVSPRKGTAIMWYNHLLDEDSGWLGPMDDYSLHGGCDILRGEKWIANNWITAPYRDDAHIPSTWLRKFDFM